MIATGRAKVDLTVCDNVARTSAGLCPVGERHEEVEEDDEMEVFAGCATPTSCKSSTFGIGYRASCVSK